MGVNGTLFSKLLARGQFDLGSPGNQLLYTSGVAGITIIRDAEIYLINPLTLDSAALAVSGALFDQPCVFAEAVAGTTSNLVQWQGRIVMAGFDQIWLLTAGDISTDVAVIISGYFFQVP